MNNLLGKVMYQMSLRTMNAKGTIKACEELLTHGAEFDGENVALEPNGYIIVKSTK